MSKSKLRKKDIKEDQLVTAAVRTSNFVQEHFTKVISGVVVLIAAIGIIVFTANARRNTAQASQRELSIAMDQFLLGDHLAASTTFLSISDRYSGHDAGRLSLYFLGESYRRLYRLDEALVAYDRYLNSAGPEGEYFIAAGIAKALCYEGLGQFPQAANEMARVTQTMDEVDSRYPDALYRAGTFYEEAGDLASAKDYFERASEHGSGQLKKLAEVKVSLYR